MEAMKTEYKVTVYVMTGYSTIVKAKSEKKAIKKALKREAPDELAYYDENRRYQWEPDGLMEFPNLGINEVPDVEEV